MASLNVRTMYQIELSNSEYRILEAALQGQLQESDMEAAQALLADLTRQKDAHFAAADKARERKRKE